MSNMLPVMAAAAAIISIIIIYILIRISVKKAEQRRQSKLSQELGPEVEKYFSDFTSLSLNFITHDAAVAFRNRWNELYHKVKDAEFDRNVEGYERFSYFISFHEGLERNIQVKNDTVLEKELEASDGILSDIDGKSLDGQQRKVVVSDEDRTLVLAGAGSGKTLTIAAKVKYLCDVKGVKPDDILLISFTNKAAQEMTERIKGRLGIPVEATTFHRLGLDIIKKGLGYRPDVYDSMNEFVHVFFENDLLDHPELVRILTEYFTYYLEIPEDIENCSSLGEFYEKEKAADLETLKSKYDREKYIEDTRRERTDELKTFNGEKVKSIEETKIANFLFMHGVRYEYERLYPYESGNADRKAYRPDFYLTDYDIYLEHFGITRDGRLPWLSPVEEEKYLDDMRWKRAFHMEHGTRLIETYSYYTKEGCLLSKLERLLLDNGVQFAPRDFTDIFQTIYAKKSEKYFSEFIKLCCTFITLFKSNGYREEDLERMKKDALADSNEFMYFRTCQFLDIIRILLREYGSYLEVNKAIDFSDMINEASRMVEEGNGIHGYRYVIVDEYQDISQARFNLVKAIVGQTRAKLLCVGDDWQSIYRFAGSDISLFTDIGRFLGYTEILRIEKTYRNSQELIDEAAAFITKNPKQLSKKLASDRHLKYPLVFWGYDSEPYGALRQIMQKIIEDFGEESSVLFLGRTGYDIDILNRSGLFRSYREDGEERLAYLPSQKTQVTFLSVHRSKGLEADNVVLLNFKNDKLGFPNQIADDKVLDYVLTHGENYMFAEERRLFYVAMTRTRNRTFVLVDNTKPSVFLKEFKESEICCFIHINQTSDYKKTHCPRCRTGELLKVVHDGKSFIGCSNFPKCRYTLKNMSILSSPKQCPSCGGFLVKRKASSGHWFVGCTNYPYCEYTEKLDR